MSRGRLILVVVLVVILGGAFILSSIDTEVAPTRIEKAVANDAVAK